MTFRKNHIGRPLSFRFYVMKIWLLVPFGLFVALLGGVAYGQAPPPITSSGLNTQISAPVNLPGGAVQHNITGGTRPGDGGNLFHSFGEFGVPTNNIANFLNDATLPTSNILSRVTGGNPSNIFGTIQTEGFGNANLFLMNPAGIVFGPDAALNVGGAAHFTTADYLRLADGVQFTALPNAQDTLLSIAPVAAFGFLNSNPPVLAAGNSAAILVEGLDVLNGNPVSLVGRDATADGTSVQGVVITEGVLRNPGGSVKIASVGGQQVPEVQQVLVNLETLDVQGNNAQGLIVQEPVQLGGILLSEGGTIDASGEIGGSVVIRGGQLMISGGGILSNANGPVEGTVTGSPQAVGNLQAAIDVETESLVIQDGGSIRAGTLSSSDGGDVRLQASDSLQIRDGGYVLTFTEGAGHAGNIEVDAGHVQLSQAEFFNDAGITSQTDFFEPFDNLFTGNTGNIRLNARHVEIMGASAIRTATFSSGNAGDVDVTVEGGNLEVSGNNAKIASTSNAIFTGGLPGNINLQIEGGDVILNDGAVIRTLTTLGIGGIESQGNIQITANNMEMRGGEPSSSEISQIAADSLGFGQAGGITVTLSGNLKMEGKTQINVISRFSADANALDITAKDIFMTGTGGPETSTLISTKSQGEGQGGNLNIMAENLTMTGQSEINARAEGTGDAGNIKVSVRNLTLSNGASVTAESTSESVDAGNAGNIQLTATDTILLDGAMVTTEAAQASGGNIKLTASELIRLNDSTIASSVQGDPNTVGGDINLDPDFIILQNSQILAKAVQGEGGNITLIANDTVLVDSFSTLDASSALGISGTVNVQAPTKFLSEAIVPLDDQPVNVATLYGARCVAGAGGHFSTFVDSKKDSLSPTPGTFLASPLLRPSAQAVADSSARRHTPVILTASIAPLVLGQSSGPTTACP
jgi:filamentous hemagglutinin family protein